MSQKWQHSAPVTVRGEFQSSENPRFGHLNGYKYRLIVYRVVSLN